MSGLRIDVQADVRKAVAFVDELGKRDVNAAAANAMNTVMRATRNKTLDEIAKVRRLKRSVIRKAVVLVNRASYYRLSTTMQAYGRPISLREYSAKQTDAGVTVNIEGERKLIPSAFGPGYRRQKKRMGGHVFQRVSAARLPIKQLWGPSIPTGFIKKQVRLAQRRVIDTSWRPEFQRQIEMRLSKLRAKYGG